MKNFIGIVVASLIGSEAVAQNVVSLEPSIGFQQRRGGFETGAPYLRKNGINVFAYGAQLRYQPSATSKWNYSLGAMMGGASFGYLVYISPSKSVNGVSSLLSGVAQSLEVWHFSPKVHRMLKNINLSSHSINQHKLKIYFVSGPQLDYMSFNQWENLNDNSITGAANSIVVKRTKLDSAQWGASIYSAVQLRYHYKGKDKLILSVYSILGLRDMGKYNLDYTLNGDKYSTTIRSRTSAVGVAIAVPITVYPLLPRKQVVQIP